MLTVQNDWIEYEATEATTAVPARRVAVRGGAACAQRVPVARVRPASTTRSPVPQRPVAHRAVAAPASGRGRLRLTRRGRFVLVVLPALLALSAGLLALSAPVAAQAAPSSPVTPRTVVVGSGDTLWTIAERIAPSVDPRTTVAALQRANGLTDGVLAAGSVLVLPVAR